MPQHLATVKNIHGRRWNAEQKVWEIPYTRLTLRFLGKHFQSEMLRWGFTLACSCVQVKAKKTAVHCYQPKYGTTSKPTSRYTNLSNGCLRGKAVDSTVSAACKKFSHGPNCDLRSIKALRYTPCATPLPRTCWKRAWTCATSKSYSATRAARPPKFTPTSRTKAGTRSKVRLMI